MNQTEENQNKRNKCKTLTTTSTHFSVVLLEVQNTKDYIFHVPHHQPLKRTGASSSSDDEAQAQYYTCTSAVYEVYVTETLEITDMQVENQNFTLHAARRGSKRNVCTYLWLCRPLNRTCFPWRLNILHVARAPAHRRCSVS